MKRFSKNGICVLLIWTLNLSWSSVALAGDFIEDFAVQCRAYAEGLDNSKYEYEIDGYNMMNDSKRTVHGKDSFTFSFPRLKLIRERSSDSGPVAREEFVYDGTTFQALTSSRVLCIGKNPQSFKLRYDYEIPLLMPISFVFYHKDSHSMWNELRASSAWKFFSENAKYAQPKDSALGTIHFLGSDSVSGTNVECNIEAGGNNLLPQKWSYSGGNLKGYVEILSWTKGNSSFPIPKEILKTVYINEKIFSSRRYSLKTFQKVSSEQFSGDTFRISSESARQVVDCDENTTFSIEE